MNSVGNGRNCLGITSITNHSLLISLENLKEQDSGGENECTMCVHISWLIMIYRTLLCDVVPNACRVHTFPWAPRGAHRKWLCSFYYYIHCFFIMLFIHFYCSMSNCPLENMCIEPGSISYITNYDDCCRSCWFLYYFRCSSILCLPLYVCISWRPVVEPCRIPNLNVRRVCFTIALSILMVKHYAHIYILVVSTTCIWTHMKTLPVAL